MNVNIPIFWYDVTTAEQVPRTIVECKSAESAQAIATLLNRMQADGLLDATTYTAAAPRPATVTVPVTPGSTIEVKGYQIDVSTVAAALIAQGP